MSAMLLETVEGLGDSPLKANAGEIWGLLQGEKEILCRHLADDGPLQGSPVNVVERESGEEGEEQIEWRHRAELENHLREIVDAQDRLMDGRYGRCGDCGAQIDPKRLFAEPTAKLCVACQTMAEAERILFSL
jgi:RNA polymerase-binding transcription factor DksA